MEDQQGKGLELRVGQINLGGSEAATKELPSLCAAHGLNIVLVQEQYGGCMGMLEVVKGKAGIYVHNLGEAAIVMLPERSGSHCVVASLTWGDWCLRIVSAYFQYSQPVETRVQDLEVKLQGLWGRGQMVIGVDTNAHSNLWYCEERQLVGRGPDAELRRRIVEEFILANDLQVFNIEGQPHTFHTVNGSSNIDVTLGNRGVKVSEWKVLADQSSSDHRLITFKVNNPCVRIRSGKSEESPMGYRDRGVSWDHFCAVLQRRITTVRLHRGAEAACADFQRVLCRTAADCLGVKRPRRAEGYEWWSAELDSLRRSQNRLRRDWQKTRRAGGEDEERVRTLFHAARVRYRQEMRKAEEGHFRRLAEGGNCDLWGLAYRMASGRVRPQLGIMNGMRLIGGNILDVQSTAKGILQTMFPDDDCSADSPYHVQIRGAAACVPSGPDAQHLTVGEVEAIIKNIPNKSPGVDGITARIIKAAWRVCSHEITALLSQCVREGVFPGVWKSGRLVVVPKCNGRAACDPKAYRPVTLLPVMGKILEHVICRCTPNLYSRISESQHGFVKGRSTVTALGAVMRIIKSSTAKYIQGIMLDISGAFDNAWWPMVLVKYKQGAYFNLFPR